MNTDNSPLESLLGRLRAALGDLSADPVSGRLQSVVEGFFEQFELVPRREYEAHLATLARLELTVGELEARIARLEQPAGD